MIVSRTEYVGGGCFGGARQSTMGRYLLLRGGGCLWTGVMDMTLEVLLASPTCLTR